MLKKSFFLSIFSAALLGFAPRLYAGIEPSSWDYLPVINEISFTTATVGFSSMDGRRMVLDKESGAFRQVSPSEYAGLMRGAKGGKAAWPEKSDARDNVTLITSSAGVFLETMNDGCYDSKKLVHVLKYGGKVIKDQVDPCDSISTAEIENGRLWLGTHGVGGYGESPGKGIIVQSLSDGTPIGTISKQEGLTSNLVRVVKLDPYTGYLWTATQLGINQLSPELEVLYALYLYEDFDESGACAVQGSTTPADNNFIAIFQRLLNVKDKRKFYEAAMSIPPEIRPCFNVMALTGWAVGSCPASVGDVNDKFLPPQFNVLAPFVIETADFSRDKMWETVMHLCIFADKDVAAIIAEHATDDAFSSRLGSYGSQCVYFYKQAGLFPDGPSKAKVKEALGRISRALSKFKLSGMNGGGVPDFQASADAVDVANGLAELGSPRGIELLNGFFIRAKAGNGNNPEVSFFSGAAQKLHYRDEFLPGVLAGVEKFYGAPVQQGCLYLDVTYPDEHKKNRAGVKQLTALIKAVENARHPEWIPHQPSQAQGAYKTCRAAAASQLKDKAVRYEFLKSVYPGLAPAYKKVADSLLSGFLVE
ncbi:MAG TPA: hypothetical protein DCZ92_05590 [Elusimicrobia bacterium]|nr:MAG: hypothetical protein A2016_06795 [Elusimicrobia bacterium GWF2_62_30]HBA60278.1 hypothetical protein [Elusimicrobiota bacterium]